MERFCPNCGVDNAITRSVVTEALDVRGEIISVEVAYYKCDACGIEYEDPNSDIKPVETAYRKYREIHGMVTPEEIIDIRKSYNLSQKELSMILGWGGATLSRYENGSLQDEAHDRMLHMVMKPENLFELIERNPDNISKRKLENIISKIKADINASCERYFVLTDMLHKPDISSGWMKLNIEKLKNVILFFCQEGTYKTSINKLLFYVDFKYFKDQGLSITGSRYAHLTYGPVIDNFQHLLAMMVETDCSLDLTEVLAGEYIAQVFTSVEETDMSFFSGKEIEIMEYVKKELGNFGSKQIADFSHDEEGYKQTFDGEYISYEFAATLQI